MLQLYHIGVVTINNYVIRMARCLYGNTGKNVRWRGKHQNLEEIWNGTNPWGFFSQPQHPHPGQLASVPKGHITKTLWALHILNLSNRSWWSAPFPSQFTFGELDPGTHWIGVGWLPCQCGHVHDPNQSPVICLKQSLLHVSYPCSAIYIQNP